MMEESALEPSVTAVTNSTGTVRIANVSPASMPKSITGGGGALGGTSAAGMTVADAAEKPIAASPIPNANLPIDLIALVLLLDTIKRCPIAQ
jgi:hypothetical protein